MSTTKTKSRKRYDKKQLEFLRKGYASMPVWKLTILFNNKFGLNKNEGQIRSTLKNHGITCGRKHADRIVRRLRLYTEQQLSFLQKQYRWMGLSELVVVFNDKYGTDRSETSIRAALRNHRIRSGRTGQFEKGIVPFNKGSKGLMKRNSGTFKKGNIPGNIRPIGAERICSKDGFVLVKVIEKNPYTGAPTRFKHKHVHLWEQKHGPVPKGMVVVFKDGNKLNCVYENLILLSRAELLRLNQKQYVKIPAELKPTVLALAKLEAKTFAREKQRRRAA